MSIVIRTYVETEPDWRESCVFCGEPPDLEVEQSEDPDDPIVRHVCLTCAHKIGTAAIMRSAERMKAAARRRRRN